MLNPPSAQIPITSITPAEITAIENFMQGAIYCWAKNRPNEPFAVRNLVGGENYYWNGTPLIVLYEAHTKLGKKDGLAETDAGKDLGCIVRNLLNLDKRTYTHTKMDSVNHYLWDGKWQ